jgi:hypothetical protein
MARKSSRGKAPRKELATKAARKALYGWFCPVPRVGVRMSVCHQLTSRGKGVCPLPLHARLLMKISTWKSQEVVATASVRIERFAT